MLDGSFNFQMITMNLGLNTLENYSLFFFILIFIIIIYFFSASETHSTA